MFYAHTLIEHGSQRYKVGEVVPDDLPGLDELVKYGSVGDTVPIVAAQSTAAVARYDGDFTGDEIDDPYVLTPLVGTHTSEDEHREQEPDHYAALDADASDEGSSDA